MPIFLSSLVGTLMGSCIVYMTSPTLATAMAGATPLTPLIAHALFIDALFALLLAFFLLCYLEHRWIATNQSFPYTFHLSRNVGTKAFDFQLVVFELWHTNKLNRYVHMLCLFAEQFLWLAIIALTFGLPALLATNALLAAQALSFRDPLLVASLTALNAAYSLSGHLLSTHLSLSLTLSPPHILALAKISLFYTVVLRTAVHAAEPLPPSFDVQTDKFIDAWGTGPGYALIPQAPLQALWLFLLGIVSELASGVPGRLCATAVWKVLSRCGYGGHYGVLMGVKEARGEVREVMEGGWGASARLAPFFEGVAGGPAVGLGAWDEKRGVVGAGAGAVRL